MTKLKTEMVYVGRNNTNDFRLTEDDEYTALTSVTKIELVLDSSITISDETPDDYPIKWEFDPAVVGKVSIKIGRETGVVAGSYKDAYFIVYDASNPQGVRWEPNVPIKVV